MFIDYEKDILKRYIYNARGFESGLSNFDLFMQHNLNSTNKVEDEYKYNRIEESEYLHTVYERIVLFMINLYFTPEHKVDRRFLKEDEIYLANCIEQYFDYINRYSVDRERNYYYDDLYKINKVGITAQKVYLASVLCLNKHGLMHDSSADIEIENIKNTIKSK